MLIVETIGRIRREYFVQGKTIREIARDLKLSRNTVRKVLRSVETAFSYGRQVQLRPKLGRWTEDLDRLLARNADAAARERMTRSEFSRSCGRYAWLRRRRRRRPAIWRGAWSKERIRVRRRAPSSRWRRALVRKPVWRVDQLVDGRQLAPLAPQTEEDQRPGKGFHDDPSKGKFLGGKWTWPGVEPGCKCVMQAVVPGFHSGA